MPRDAYGYDGAKRSASSISVTNPVTGKLSGVEIGAAWDETGKGHDFWPTDVPVRNATFVPEQYSWWNAHLKFDMQPIDPNRRIDYSAELYEGANGAGSPIAIKWWKSADSTYPSDFVARHMFSGLKPRTQYTVKVQASTTSGLPVGDPALLSTKTDDLLPPKFLVANLSYDQDQTKAQLSVTFQPTPYAEDKSKVVYELWRAPATQESQKLLTNVGDATFQLANLLMDTQYAFRVRAVAKGVTSAFVDFRVRTAETAQPFDPTDPAYDETPKEGIITPLDVWGYSSSFGTGDATYEYLSEMTGATPEAIKGMEAWSWKDDDTTKKFMGKWAEKEAGHGIAPGTTSQDYATFVFYQKDDFERYEKYLAKDSKTKIAKVEVWVKRSKVGAKSVSLSPRVYAHRLGRKNAGKVSPHDQYFKEFGTLTGLIPDEGKWLALPESVWKRLFNRNTDGDFCGLMLGRMGTVAKPNNYPKGWAGAVPNWMTFVNVGKLRITTDKQQKADEKVVSERAKKLLRIAKERLGTKYAKGGDDPKEGFDSVGFVKWAFSKIDVTTGATMMKMLERSSNVASGQVWQDVIGKAVPGDVLLWNPENGYEKSPNGMVAIYAGNGMCYGVSKRAGVSHMYVSLAYQEKEASLTVRRYLWA